ncbi:DUF914-domain-containing protein [Myriangium duriaei CBS 260.36]|uniref:DUF914-domain-containing protein n=1 Tax=Myriangium duriaei CBS 260.36 TaxID=1168546 RepID=A0A9P4IW12_9PEZI|nr:DUF914-domain-containing protein [Myriangium duriaei CBS 260.36]
MATSDLAIAPIEQEQEQHAPERISVKPKGVDSQGNSSKSSLQEQEHGRPQVVGNDENKGGPTEPVQQPPVTRTKKAFAYLRSRDFWIVLALSQTLALCQTGTNTFTGLLNQEGTSIPAFQSFFNYVLLNIVYTGYTIYRYGFKGWFNVIKKDGWRYLILAFFDVEGNYFVVKGYQYTNIVSAELFSFWTIVVVVVLSFIFLKVRYHIAQYAGILVCCAGFGVMIGSDRITNGSASGPNPVKGDLFVLLSASLYGCSNVIEEFLVSKKPMYEVIGQLAFYGMVINGAQAGIFDRTAFHNAVWDGKVGGYLTGYTLLLFIFYSLAPIVFRMSSAAFFNIGLLTGNFWSLAVGVGVFGYHIHWMYPLAFVLIILGHFVYYGTEGVLGDAKKPWLGENQEDGVEGIGSARRRMENPHAIV